MFLIILNCKRYSFEVAVNIYVRYIQTISPRDSVQPVIPRAAVRDFAAKMSRSVRVIRGAIQNREHFGAVDVYNYFNQRCSRIKSSSRRQYIIRQICNVSLTEMYCI